MKKKIVVSAVNLTRMGPLSVLCDALRYLSAHHAAAFEIIALVHRRTLCNFPNIRYLEFPSVKSSWLRRLYYEFVLFKTLSYELNPYLWLSLHDITPNVNAAKRAVYCHNPSPFYDLQWREALLDPRFALFNWFYSDLYRLNIRKNDFVIVQQEWLRHEFECRYGLNNIIVAHPDMGSADPFGGESDTEENSKVFRFFYPCFPQIFKNVETVLSATRLLEQQGLSNFQVLLTMEGRENAYARRLLSRFGDLKRVAFLGTLDRSEVFRLYAQADCLIFASKLETWGLPITEFKTFGKPMLVANLPYAHETVGNYPKVVYFEPNDAGALATIMSAALSKMLAFHPSHASAVRPPYAKGWAELFAILLQDAA